MTPADRPRAVRVLASDGVEVEATEVGTVVVPDSGDLPGCMCTAFPIREPKSPS